MDLEHDLQGFSSLGEQLNGQPLLITWFNKRRCSKDRIIRDLPVPFGPEIRTPPIFGSTSVSKQAVFILSFPIEDENGGIQPLIEVSTVLVK